MSTQQTIVDKLYDEFFSEERKKGSIELWVPNNEEFIERVQMDIKNADLLSPDFFYKVKKFEEKLKIDIELIFITQKESIADLDIQSLQNMLVKLNEEEKKRLKISISNQVYPIELYIQCKKALNKLTENINPNLSELEKFSIIYKRICKQIRYDYKAVYPVTKKDLEYSRQEIGNTQNIVNGLTKGITVCEGYSKILIEALELIGIEARIVENDNHAWNMVKLDGIWYHCDVTWDAPIINLGMSPIYCLLTDKQIKKIGVRNIPNGIKCDTKFPRGELHRIFSKVEDNVTNLTFKQKTKFLTQILLADVRYVALNRCIELYKLIKPKMKSMNYLPETSRKYISETKPWDLENWGLNKKDIVTKEIEPNLSEDKKQREDINPRT